MSSYSNKGKRGDSAAKRGKPQPNNGADAPDRRRTARAGPAPKASDQRSAPADRVNAPAGVVKAKSTRKRPAKKRRAAGPGAKVVTVGSVMADTIAVAEAELVERAELKRSGVTLMLIEEGRKYTAESIVVHLGGGGANSAVAATRLGWKAATLATVGGDANGDFLLQRLSEEGVDVSAIRRNPDVATGVSLIVSSERANAAILIFRGANETLRVEDLRDAVFEGADLVYIGPLSSGSADCYAALVEQGAWSGAMVCVNPGVRQLRSRGDAFLGAVANVDLVSINAREFSVLTLALFARGLASAETAPPEILEETDQAAPRLTTRLMGEGAQMTSLRTALSALHGIGPRFISVTDGAYGSYLSVADPDGEAVLYFQEPAPVEMVQGTAGAGDSYGSTLACSLAQGLSPEDAMRRAALNAASVVSERNTTDGLMSLEALDLAAQATPMAMARQIEFKE